MKFVARGVALAVAFAAAGCGSGPKAPAPAAEPSPTVTSAPPVSDYELVRAAYRRTRAAATGRFVADVTLDAAGARLTMRRTGAYDAARRLSSAEQTLSSNPPGLIERATKGRTAADLRAHVVVADSRAYLQMPAWRPPAKGRWLALTRRDFAQSVGVDIDLDAASFPLPLAMLAEVRPSADDGSRRDEVPPVARVAVSAKEAFLAGPSNLAARLLATGYNPDRITGSVEVEVVIERGLITKVSFDAQRAVEQALEDTEAKARFDAVPMTITVSAHGKRQRIVVPPPSLVMKPEELEQALGG